MPVSIPESHLDLFEKKSIAYLAVHLSGDAMMVNPVWCSFDGTHVLVNSVEGRLKDRVMRKHPAVTLCITDPDNSFRYLEVRGKVAEITTEGALENINALAKRYLGTDEYPYMRPGDVRVLYKIVPEKVNVMAM